MSFSSFTIVERRDYFNSFNFPFIISQLEDNRKTRGLKLLFFLMLLSLFRTVKEYQNPAERQIFGNQCFSQTLGCLPSNIAFNIEPSFI